MRIHHIDITHEHGSREWGWECWTCGDATTNYDSRTAAEKGTEEHRVEAATSELIEAGDLP